MPSTAALYYWCGIEPSFTTFWGEQSIISDTNKDALLEAMGIDVSSSESLEKAHYELDIKPWLDIVPSFQTCWQDAISLPFCFKQQDLKERIDWEIEVAGERVYKGSCVLEYLSQSGNYTHDEVVFQRRQIELPDLAIGYYKVNVSFKGQLHSTTLLSAPRQCYQPQISRSPLQEWGTIIQLYTLRSERNWGIGDFTDLKALIYLLAPFGAGVIGLNPVHALLPNLNDKCSPYSPSDRRFISPLYLDVEQVYGFSLGHVTKSQFEQIRVLREVDNVDYQRVYDLKIFILRCCFIDFYKQPDAKKIDGFLQFVELKQESLLAFSKFEATYQPIPEGAVVFEQQDWINFTEDMEQAFHCFLQWQSHLQMASIQRIARESGFLIGIYKDLAVGADGAGSEVNQDPNLFCQRAAIGAPPDPLAPLGQNWGMPPINPVILRRNNFDHFIELLRSNMADCGALRIDHAMSLMRLWWSPSEKDSSEGAYVNYPFDDLLKILCYESVSHKCAVIAEDLGVVPDAFRHAITEAGFYSNKVIYFEREENGDFRSPTALAKHALAMLNNHDVPTLRSWWVGSDIELRFNLGMYGDNSDLQSLLAERDNEKKLLLNKMAQLDVIGINQVNDYLSTEELTMPLLKSILIFSASTNCELFVLQLEDLLLMDEPVNVPGTFKEYPNWQRKLTKTIEAMGKEQSIIDLLKTVNEIRERGK